MKNFIIVFCMMMFNLHAMEKKPDLIRYSLSIEGAVLKNIYGGSEHELSDQAVCYGDEQIIYEKNGIVVKEVVCVADEWEKGLFLLQRYMKSNECPVTVALYAKDMQQSFIVEFFGKIFEKGIRVVGLKLLIDSLEVLDSMLIEKVPYIQMLDVSGCPIKTLPWALCNCFCLKMILANNTCMTNKTRMVRVLGKRKSCDGGPVDVVLSVRQLHKT